MTTPAARARHEAGRALLRRLVAAEVGCRPAEVVVRAGPTGQPLVDPADLHVSVAHTDGLVVAVVVRGRAVGIDVERTGRSPLPPDRLWLTDRDRRRLARLRPADRPAALVRCWTAKEAVAKACGSGLGAPLRAIEVSDAVAWNAVDPTVAWRLHDVATRPGFTTTLAVAWPGVAPGPPVTDRDGAGAPQSAGEGRLNWNCPAAMPHVAGLDHVTSIVPDTPPRKGRTTRHGALGVPPW